MAVDGSDLRRLLSGEQEGEREAKDRMNKKCKIEIKTLRDTLSPLGWFYKHNAMHNGAIPIEYDQWGRCARCVTLGFFRCDA